MSATRWRPALRLAWREVRRHPLRHLLVVALIFVSVLAVFATFSILDTWQANEVRQAEFHLAGRAGGFGDVVERADRSRVARDGVATPGPIAGLPKGSHVETWRSGADWFVLDRHLPGGRGPALAGAEVLDAPEGTRRSERVVVDRGRLPRAADEVLLSPALAAADASATRSTPLRPSSRTSRPPVGPRTSAPPPSSTRPTAARLR